MKIEKIKLTEQKIVEKDNEFALEYVEKETVPCVITNRALKIAHEMGVTNISMMTDLMNMSMGDGEKEVGDIDEMKILKTIYVGYIGGQVMKGNKAPEYDFDEFLELYNESIMDRGTLYQKLLMAEQENNFADKIEKSTKKSEEGKK